VLILAIIFLFPIIAFTFALTIGVMLAITIFSCLIAAVGSLVDLGRSASYTSQQQRLNQGVVMPNIMTSSTPNTANPIIAPTNQPTTAVIITNNAVNLNDILKQLK